MGSRLKYDLCSHRKLPIIGTLVGPGGSFLLVFEDWMIVRIDFMTIDMQTDTMIINHVSVFVCVCVAICCTAMVFGKSCL